MKHDGKSSKRKSKTGKRKSAEIETAIDQERESARALLQMRGVPLDDAGDLYHGDDVAASQQLIAESSPHNAADQPMNGANVKQRPLGTPRKRNKFENRKGGKKSRGDPFAFPSSEERSHGDTKYPNLPSTPPRQTTRSSPSPYRPTLSQSNHALDDIPTDDEDITQYMQEFAVYDDDAPRGVSEEDNVYGFSQQPLDAPDHDHAHDEIHSAYQLPKSKAKKRKRATASTSEHLPDEQLPLINGEGQHALDVEIDFEAFDELFNDAMNSANPFSVHEANNMPIDPELHSMSQLPPSVDLSQLDIAGEHSSQKTKRKRKTDSSSKVKKRRRVEEVQGAGSAERPNHTPYRYDHDQENIQDQVLPGVEDLQRQMSPELGSPFMKNLAHQGLEYMNDRAQPKITRRKKSKAKEVQARKISSQNGEDPKRARRENSGNGGPFTDTEASKLDAFRDTYCDANDMTTAQYNSRIQTTLRGNADVLALFNEIQDVLPYRPRMSVQKFCRRRYHNFTARGTWSPEDDEMLRQAVAEKGKQWKIVGDMVDRMAEDCRDRYRNYILNAENRNHEAWTAEEVRRLCTAVLDSIEAMKDERRQERRERLGDNATVTDSGSDMDVEDLKAINWQVISDRMEGQRSRLQCSGKWRQLEKQEKEDVAQSILDQRGLQGRRLQPTKNPWRMKNATKMVANMKSGDMHALVQAILDCRVPAEGNIPWKAIGDDDLRATWNSTAKKAAWSKLKQGVPDWQSMNYRDIASHLLTKIEDDSPGDLEERWDPEVHRDITGTKPRKSKKSRGKEIDGREVATNARKTRAKAKKNYKEAELKSNEFVQDSDDDDDLEISRTYEPQNCNHFDPLRSPTDGSTGFDMNGNAASTTADVRQEPVTNGNGDDEDMSSLYNGSMTGDNDELDDEMVDPQISPRMARTLRTAISDALGQKGGMR